MALSYSDLIDGGDLLEKPGQARSELHVVDDLLHDVVVPTVVPACVLDAVGAVGGCGVGVGRVRREEWRVLLVVSGLLSAVNLEHDLKVEYGEGEDTVARRGGGRMEEAYYTTVKGGEIALVGEMAYRGVQRKSREARKISSMNNKPPTCTTIL